MGQRVGSRPVLERRPADRVVAGLAGEDRLEHRAVALGLGVVVAVDEGVRRAVPVPRLAAVDAATEELEGHPVGVGVDVAAHLLERRGAGERRSGDADVCLGVARAARRRAQRETARLVAGGESAARRGEPASVGEPERESAVASGGGPVGVLGRLVGQPVGAHERLVAGEEEVGAEVGGLEADRLAGHRVAAAGHGVPVPGHRLSRLTDRGGGQLRVGRAAVLGDVGRVGAPLRGRRRILGGLAEDTRPGDGVLGGAVGADRDGDVLRRAVSAVEVAESAIRWRRR